MGNPPILPPPAANLIYCLQAKELLDALAETIRDLVTLHEAQFQAVIAGDLEIARFEELIHMANERKHEAKYAYMAHLESHRCSNYVAASGETPKAAGV